MARRSRPRRSRRRGVPPRVAPPGASPGLLAIEEAAPRPTVVVTRYTAEAIETLTLESVDELVSLRGEPGVLWVDVCGLGDAAVIEQIGSSFGLHPLALEDVAHGSQRGKAEEYDGHLFVILRRALSGESGETEQISLFLGEDFLVSFRERVEDWLRPIRERLGGSGRIRQRGADYLAYALIDAAIDHTFPVAERFGDRLDRLEELVLDPRQRQLAADIQVIRHELFQLRRALAPVSEAVARMLRPETAWIDDGTRVYLRDCQDHALRSVELLDAYRELAADLMNLHLADLSHRMNEVMRTLTIIATLFIPLSFVAGLYGMNFDSGVSPWNMPELGWYWGYPFALSIMAAVALAMLAFFWRKGWLGRKGDD